MKCYPIRLALAALAFLSLTAETCGDMSEEKKSCYQDVNSAWVSCKRDCRDDGMRDIDTCKGICDGFARTEKMRCDGME